MQDPKGQAGVAVGVDALWPVLEEEWEVGEMDEGNGRLIKLRSDVQISPPASPGRTCRQLAVATAGRSHKHQTTRSRTLEEPTRNTLVAECLSPASMSLPDAPSTPPSSPTPFPRAKALPLSRGRGLAARQPLLTSYYQINTRGDVGSTHMATYV